MKSKELTLGLALKTIVNTEGQRLYSPLRALAVPYLQLYYVMKIYRYTIDF